MGIIIPKYLYILSLIYIHKVSTTLKESELDLLEKWLWTHKPIQKEIVDEWVPLLVWEVREWRKKAKR